MVSGDVGIVLVDLAVALHPVVVLALRQPRPGYEARHREFGEVGQVADAVDDLVAGVMGSPATIQGSPSSFFSATCSSDSTAMT